jgi:membrane protease YdiL (CAAX protease family)
VRVWAGAAYWPTFLIATLSFAAVHSINIFIYEASSWSGILSQIIYALLIGALFGFLALQLRRVWPVVLLHAGLNIGLATQRLSEPVFAVDFRLSPVALVVMGAALLLALIGGLRYRSMAVIEEQSVTSD